MLGVDVHLAKNIGDVKAAKSLGADEDSCYRLLRVPVVRQIHVVGRLDRCCSQTRIDKRGTATTIAIDPSADGTNVYPFDSRFETSDVSRSCIRKGFDNCIRTHIHGEMRDLAKSLYVSNVFTTSEDQEWSPL